MSGLFIDKKRIFCSIYKNYICYQKHGGRLTIEKLINPYGRLLEETWFTRVYSPKNITCINMWNGVCTILIGNDVRKVNYVSKNILPASEYHEKCLVNFSSIPNSMTSHQIHQILRDDIIIVLCKFQFLGGIICNQFVQIGLKI